MAKYCYQCPYYCDKMNTNTGYCSKLATDVFGDEIAVEQPCHDDEL